MIILVKLKKVAKLIEGVGVDKLGWDWNLDTHGASIRATIEYKLI